MSIVKTFLFNIQFYSKIGLGNLKTIDIMPLIWTIHRGALQQPSFENTQERKSKNNITVKSK